MKRPWLLPLAPLYGLITDLRNWAYTTGRKAAYRAPVPVISVGNLSTGGTGKTPVAEWLLGWLSEQGHRAAYLSRGYGRDSQGYQLVQRVGGTVEAYGDEALQVALKFPQLPVAVCADRRVGMERLVAEQGAEVIVLDDAFQHRRVARDRDWVVIDAQRLPTQDFLLPAGNLRERRRHLRRADLLLVNRVAEAAEIPALRRALAPYERPMAFLQPQWPHLLRPGRPEPVALQRLKGHPVILLVGIGHPEAFAQQVEALGAQVVARRFYPDHRRFTPRDAAEWRQLSQTHPRAWLLTTEKDATRLRHQAWFRPYEDLPLYFAPLRLRWLAGETEAQASLQALLAP